MQNQDNTIDFKVEEKEMDCGVKIKVIGVGGAGGNMINHMINSCDFSNDIDLMIANTDIQDMRKSQANIKIQLGEKKTGGHGAGACPEVGRISAEEAEEELIKQLEGTDMLFIAAGLGGGTGTGAAPVIARIAKSLGILVVSVVTLPFSFEQRARMKQAQAGLIELKKESDCVIEIHNDKLLAVAPRDLNPRKAYVFVDNVLVNAVSGIINVLLVNGDTNIDFSDMQTIMSYRGVALMSMGSGKGENAIEDACKQAIDSPLLDSHSTNIHSAKGLIIFFKYGENISFAELAGSIQNITGEDNEDIQVIHGWSYCEELAEDEVELIIIATGFDETKAEQELIAAESKRKLEEQKAAQSNIGEARKVSGGGVAFDYRNVDYDEPAFLRNSQD